MTNIQNNKHLIAKNTLFLYTRSIVVMVVGLYTSRIVMMALGINDYGLYNVIAGFVTLFSILSASLVNASQRFMSFEMGKEVPQMNRIFCGIMSLHLLATLFVFILLETFGVWFLNTHLNIQPERISAANWVFQCSVLTFCVNLISISFNACIIAHERMDAFAFISLYEVFAKLGIVYLLLVTDYDKLVLYAVLMLAIAISLRFIYGLYCKKHFEECKFSFVIDKPLFKEMLNFTGWNFFGSTAGILSTQGITILINLFFGVTLNAARGVAEQINQAINTFINNFMTAVNPQITKSYAAGDIKYMNNLIAKGAKYATLLFWFLALVFFVDADTIMNVWLVEVPPFAPIFLRLAIIFTFFQSLSHTLYIAMLSTGTIKTYQIVMGTLYLGAFILCYVFFKLGLGPEYGYYSTLIAVFIALFVRIKLIRKMIPNFLPMYFIKEAVIKSGLVVISSTLITVCCKNLFYISNKYLELSTTLIVAMLSVSSISFLFAFTKTEKNAIINYTKHLFRTNH